MFVNFQFGTAFRNPGQHGTGPGRSFRALEKIGRCRAGGAGRTVLLAQRAKEAWDQD